MTSGQSFGAGIYCANSLNTSYSYCINTNRGGIPDAIGNYWPKSSLNKPTQCMAICEIVNEETNKETPTPGLGNIRVVKDEASITTRYLLVNPENVPCECNNLVFNL